MLNGISPIILFNFFKATPSTIALLNKIPFVSDVFDAISFPPIPLYLDENLTGILVSSESKNIDIETDLEAKKDGTDPVENQKPVNSSTTIELIANKNSIGLTILCAMMDQVVPKLASREYSITYLHGAVTVFGAKLHSFATNQNADDTRVRIAINLTRSTQKTKIEANVPVVSKVTGVLPL